MMERKVGRITYTRHYFEDRVGELIGRTVNAVPEIMRPPGFTPTAFQSIQDAYERGLEDGQRSTPPSRHEALVAATEAFVSCESKYSTESYCDNEFNAMCNALAAVKTTGGVFPTPRGQR